MFNLLSEQLLLTCHLAARLGVHASAPIFEGTRIRVSTVQGYLRHGFDTAAILNAFPDLDAADVRTAERMLSAAG